MEPVHPRPTITTSFGGSLRAMYTSTLVRFPVIATGDADGRIRVALVVTAHPVGIVITGAREADHLPGTHVVIAAVDWIGEESLLRVLEQLLKESRAVHATLQLHHAALQAVQDLILLLWRELRESLARTLRHLAGTDILVESIQAR